LSGLISSFLNLYFIAVGMRILGLFYVAKQGELGWFSRLRHKYGAGFGCEAQGVDQPP
jgi:hypothetical protein